MSDQQKPKAPAASPPPEPRTVTLTRPIMKEGSEVSTLTIAEPRLKHFKVLDQLKLRIDGNGATLENLGSLAKMGAEQLAGLTELEAAELTWGDTMEIAMVVMDFFDFSLPEIGESPSGP